MTARIYDFKAEKSHRQQDLQTTLATYDDLDCPHCGMLTKPFHVTAAHVTSYKCDGGHSWRIDEDGALMRGLKGNRYF